MGTDLVKHMKIFSLRVQIIDLFFSEKAQGPIVSLGNLQEPLFIFFQIYARSSCNRTAMNSAASSKVIKGMLECFHRCPPSAPKTEIENLRNEVESSRIILFFYGNDNVRLFEVIRDFKIGRHIGAINIVLINRYTTLVE